MNKERRSQVDKKYKERKQKISMLLTQFMFIIILVILLLIIISESNKQKETDSIQIKSVIEKEDNKEIYEVQTPQTMLEWIKQVDRKEPKLGVWNSNSYEGIIFEDAQQYTLKEGDILFLCYDENKNASLNFNFGIACKVVKGACFYSMVVNQKFEEPTKLTMEITVDDVDYQKEVYLLTEDNS